MFCEGVSRRPLHVLANFDTEVSQLSRVLISMDEDGLQATSG